MPSLGCFLWDIWRRQAGVCARSFTSIWSRVAGCRSRMRTRHTICEEIVIVMVCFFKVISHHGARGRLCCGIAEQRASKSTCKEGRKAEWWMAVSIWSNDLCLKRETEGVEVASIWKEILGAEFFWVFFSISSFSPNVHGKNRVPIFSN